MRIKILLLTLLTAMVVPTSAQDTLQGHRNSVRVSLYPTGTATPFVTYERTLGSGFSLEAGGFYHNGTNTWRSNIFPASHIGAMAGVKYLFVTNEKYVAPRAKARYIRLHQLKRAGFLCSGTYLKAEIGYQHLWRNFDCFVGNEGYTLITENRTYHGNLWDLGFDIGYQVVASWGLVAETYIGLRTPLASTGEVHSNCTPNYFFYLRGGVKLGWAF